MSGFRPRGPVQVPIVNNGRYDNHTLDTINIQVRTPSTTAHSLSTDGKKPTEVHSGFSDEFTPQAQAGVLSMEATTMIWSQQHLIAAYLL